MRVLLRPRLWRTLTYRLAVVGVCAAYLLVALEIPLPVFVHKNSTVPFPCQDHPCGCQTAEECWTHCCCFTVQQRWAWARSHNIEPPAYAAKLTPKAVETVAADGWNTPKLRQRGQQATAPAQSCCAAGEHSTCCASSKSAGKKTPSSPSQSVRWGTVLSAWHCQGQPTVWVNAGSVLPVLPAAWSPDETPPTVLVLDSLPSDIMPSIPPDPPPRSLSI